MRLLLLICLLALPLRATLNESIMLDSIAAVETGNRDLVGAAGERGPYQLIPSVAARVGGHDRRAAQRWFKIMIVDLTRRGVFVSPHSVSLAWNAGARATAQGRAPESSYLYANRVVQTYESRMVRALGRPLAKPPQISLTPPMFVVPSHP